MIPAWDTPTPREEAAAIAAVGREGDSIVLMLAPVSWQQLRDQVLDTPIREFVGER